MINLGRIHKGLSILFIAFLLLTSSVFIANSTQSVLANHLTENVNSSESKETGYGGFYRNLQEGNQGNQSNTDALDTSSSAARKMNEKQNYLRNSKSNSQAIQQPVQDTAEDGSNAIQRAADNVREKLNLDEPVPQSTKDFLSDVQHKVDDVVAPLTGQ